MKAAQTKQDAAQAEANINELRVKYEAIKSSGSGSVGWANLVIVKLSRNYRADYNLNSAGRTAENNWTDGKGAQRGDSR